MIFWHRKAPDSLFLDRMLQLFLGLCVSATLPEKEPVLSNLQLSSISLLIFRYLFDYLVNLFHGIKPDPVHTRSATLTKVSLWTFGSSI